MDLSKCGYQTVVVLVQENRLEDSTWYIDSGCCRHMTGNKNFLSDVIKCSGPNISFGDNSKGKAVGKGKIVHGNIIVSEVLLVDN